ncbi:hypothetical protein BGZ82_007535 [Podila clonocystis]|nr:hypothetical protein BGZ82_007535 [Podila clonocystis]
MQHGRRAGYMLHGIYLYIAQIIDCLMNVTPATSDDDITNWVSCLNAICHKAENKPAAAALGYKVVSAIEYNSSVSVPHVTAKSTSPLCDPVIVGAKVVVDTSTETSLAPTTLLVSAMAMLQVQVDH